MSKPWKKHAPVPFWFWNGCAEPAEITRQMELAQAAGMRGLAVHARVGNQIEYLSERWMTLVRHVCTEARRLGLEIWIYDEEGCPSGTVGLRIFDDTDFFRQKALRFAYTTVGELRSRAAETIAAFPAEEPATPTDWQQLPDHAEVLAFTRFIIPMNYCDTLQEETVRKFIRMTHERYAETLGEFFGDPITAIYTDDLNLMQCYTPEPLLPYTDTLEAQFRNRNGYSLIANLSLLVEDIGDFITVRRDYRRTVMAMFLENFVIPMRQWCEAHALPLTGHLSGDEGPYVKSINRFSAAMPFFAAETIPGIDEYLLTMPDSGYLRRAANARHYALIPVAKMLASAARQFGDGACTSEVLTSRGWGVPVADQMAAMRTQMGLGVSIMVPHAFAYATAEIAKRDHPASYFFQQPYFEFSRSWWTSLSRSAALLARGSYAADTLLITPDYTAQAALNGAQIAPAQFTPRHPARLPKCEFYDRVLAEWTLALTRAHWEFELGDELLLAGHGRVEADGTLHLGSCAYRRVLLLPEMRLLPTTERLLNTFRAAGGTVLTQLPDPLPSPSELTITGSEEVLSRALHTADGMEYFLLNLGVAAAVVQPIPGLYVYDPDRDSEFAFDAPLTIPPLGARHLLRVAARDRSQPAIPPLATLPQAPSRVVTELNITLTHDNMLLLDCGDCGYFGTARVAAGTVVNLEFELPEPERLTAIYGESVAVATLKLNGRPLRQTLPPHPASPDLHGVRPENVQPGRNRLSFIADGRRLEPLYLSGSFAVALSSGADFTNAYPTVPQALHPGELSTQGLPFYWGGADYEFEFTATTTAATLQWENCRGVAVVYRDDAELATIFQAPYTLTFATVPRSRCRMRIRVLNTAQNLFGPHRRLLIFGPNRAFEGSSEAAWTPECRGENDADWGIAPFGIDAINVRG